MTMRPRVASLTIAARGSPLSKIQVKEVEDAIKASNPRIRIEEVWVTTEGDRSRRGGFEGNPKPGVFEKEVDLSVLSGEADVGVHSLKDIPTEIPDGLEIAACLPRGPAGDILVFRRGERRPLGALSEETVIGTSSTRRSAIVHYHSPEARVLPIRGNVGTRIKKLERGEYDALLMAEAGVRRLSLNPERSRLPLSSCPPSPGQGIIALVARKQDAGKFADVKTAAGETWDALVSERAFLEKIAGGCSKPVGGCLDTRSGVFHAAEWREDGSARRVAHLGRNRRSARELGLAAAKLLLATGWDERD